MKVGIVGLDNSHCVIFTKMLNDSAYEYYVPGARVVCAYRGGSDQFSMSRNRIDGFTEELTDRYGVALYDSIEQVAADVDALFLESTDGRQHLEQFRQMAIGKPVYVDKPFATSAADARAIVELATEKDTPLLSCSSLRYAPGVSNLAREDDQIIACAASGPAPILENYPGLFWYGIHIAELIFSYMGAGCERVRCLPYPDMDVAIGEWGDGRIGIFRGTRLEDTDYGRVVHTNAGTRVGAAKNSPPYFLSFLLQKIMRFFETGRK